MLYVNIIPLTHPYTTGWPYKFRQPREYPPDPDDLFNYKTDLVIGIPVNTTVGFLVIYFTADVFQYFYYGRSIMKKKPKNDAGEKKSSDVDSS